MTSKPILAAAIPAALVLALAVPGFAQNVAPIEQRQKLMKQNGADTKAGAGFLKGETPYDAAKAKMIFTSMHGVATKFGSLFPADSKTGNKTTAAPAIWAEPAKFKAAVAKFEADTKTAMTANLDTPDAFKAQFGAVTANCKSCHEAFRIKDN